MRIIIGTIEQVPQVEMGMPATPCMDIDMDQIRRSPVVGNVKPRLFNGFSECRFPWHLPGIDMATRLEPHAEPSMFEQHRPASTDDDR